MEDRFQGASRRTRARTSPRHVGASMSSCSRRCPWWRAAITAPEERLFQRPEGNLLATCKRCSCGPQRAASRVSQRRFGIGPVGPGVSSRSFNGLIVRQRLRWPGRRAFLSGRSVPATREHPSCGSSDPCRAGPPLGALSGGQRGLPQDVEPFAAMDERLITGCAPPPRP
jgi:hypothetical protein